MTTLRIILWTLACVTLAKCDSSFDPFTAEQNPPFFVITGTISNKDTTQHVRAQMIRSEPTGNPTLNEFVVTSTEVPGSGTITWRDSIVTFADNSLGHLFTTDASFSTGSTVTITAEIPSERKSVSVSTTLPRRPTFVEGNIVTVGTTLNQDIAMSGITSQPRNVQVVYNVIPPETGVITPIAIDYLAPLNSVSNRFTTTVLLSRDYATVLGRLGRVGTDNQIRLSSISLNMDIVSDNWGDGPPAGRAISYLASSVRESYSWSLSAAQKIAIGYSGN